MLVLNQKELLGTHFPKGDVKAVLGIVFIKEYVMVPSMEIEC